MSYVKSQDIAQLKEAFKKDVADNPAIFGSGVSNWYHAALGWAIGKEVPSVEARAFASEMQIEMPSN